MGHRSPYPPPSADEQEAAKRLIERQVKLLCAIVPAMRGLGIKTWAQVRAWKAQKLLGEPLWKISEAYGKHKTRYVSVKAARYMLANKDWRRQSPAPIEHDHIVDRKVLAREILEHPRRLPQLSCLSIACLVRKEEHPEAPGDIHAPWEKYARLEILDCLTGKLVHYDKHGNPRHWHDRP